MKKVIITGPTGAIGNALVRLYFELGYEIFAIIKPNSERANRLPKSAQIKIIECDIKLYHTLSNIRELHNAEAWIHLAWAGTVGEARNNQKIQQLNVDCAVNAAKTAIEIGCKTFVFAGSQAEYGRISEKINKDIIPCPESQYGIAKLDAGHKTLELCKLSGVKHVYCRILSVYGPFDGTNSMISITIDRLLRGEKPSFTPAEQLWDYMYSKDAAKAIYHLIEKGRTGTVYCLGSGTARPLKDYINIISKVVNPGVKLGIGEIPYGEKQVMYLCADISDLITDTGYIPDTDFEKGIRETVKEYKKEKNW